MKKFLLAIVGIFFFLSGCVPSVPTDTSTTSGADAGVSNAVSSPTASQTPYPVTKTPGHPNRITHTPTSSPPILTPQPVQIDEDAPVCSPVGLNANLEITGEILYQKDDYRGLFAAGRDPSLAAKTIVSESQRIRIFGVSPDRKWIAYTPIGDTPADALEQTNPVVILLSTDGEKIEQTLNMDWVRKNDRSDYILVDFVGGYWLNDHLIFTYVNSKLSLDTPTPLSSPEVGLFEPFIFDPFQGKVETDLMEVLSGDGFTGYAISPSVQRILTNEKGVVLKDITPSEPIITSWVAPSGTFSAFDSASWSPSSEWAVIGVNIFSENERPLRTLLLSKDGRAALDLRNSVFTKWAKHFYWSPDSSRFALITSDDDGFELVVFDLTNQQFAIRCRQETKYAVTGLVWSPDASWIAVSVYHEPVRVININTRLITPLDIIGDVVGWSNN